MDAPGESTAPHAAQLRRELRVADLVLAQVIYIVGSTWVGTAGKLGPSHVVMWLLASATFFVPLVIVVVFLNRWRPLEGGLYQWAKLGFGESFGFLVAWNLWLHAIVILSSLGLEVVTFLSYTMGERTKWLATSRGTIVAVTVGVTAMVAAFAAVGLRTGKWLHNAGGAMRIGTYAMLVLLPVVLLSSGRHVDGYSLAPTRPALSVFSVNILAKMGFGAFSGLEYVAIFAGEARDPGRSIARASLFAAPVVIAMFILGTASVTAFVRPQDIDLIAPLPQALAAGVGSNGFGRLVASLASLALAASLVSYGSATFSGVARLPMVAGWDGLLPAWFTRLHPRFKTPTHSIAFLAVVTVAVGLAGLAGVGEQEAFQLFASAALICYALTYLVMFALPLVARRRAGMPEAPWWLTLACVSGFASTALFVVLAVFPIVRVRSDAAFTSKVTVVVIAANLLGASLFLLERRRRRASAAKQ